MRGKTAAITLVANNNRMPESIAGHLRLIRVKREKMIRPREKNTSIFAATDKLNGRPVPMKRLYMAESAARRRLQRKTCGWFSLHNLHST